MKTIKLLTGTILLILNGVCFSQSIKEPSILFKQIESMPEDFKEHFFNTPLSARIILDGEILGDAMISLTKAGRIKIIRYTDVADSEYDESERKRWLTAFSTPTPLGKCGGECPPGLEAVDYNLSDARLTLLSQANKKRDEIWYALPENNNLGLLLLNQFNASGGQDQSALSWNGGVESAWGNWSTTSQFQYDYTNNQSGSMSSSDGDVRHAITALYSQREFPKHFFRVGLFTPNSQGLLRQPYMSGGGVSTLFGVMAGSSDTLLKERGVPSLYPIYVTANREGVAEVFRDGSLIYSQPVTPGLQLLDTSLLPSGIYEVEIQIMEDGRETSRMVEVINKPINWRVPGQRVRYNFFAGKEETLWNSEQSQGGSDLAAGASINWLAQPQAIIGTALQIVGEDRQLGLSLDWQVMEPIKIYANLWRSNLTGYGLNSQGIWTHPRGNIALNNNSSWYNSAENTHSDYNNKTNTSSLSSTWRFNSENNITGRVSYSNNSPGVGADISFNTMTTISGKRIRWQLSGFDRPYSDSDSGNLRNRGVGLNISFALGKEDSSSSGSISIGSRTDTNGSRDLYASATVNQDWGETSPIKTTSATLITDGSGTGISLYNGFNTSLAEGSFWGQKSTYGGSPTGGVNSSSLVAFGNGQVTVSKQVTNYQESGVIVNVKSDDENTQLVALGESGKTLLTPGRNFIPVESWKPGTLQLDFLGSEALPLKIEPEHLNYHLLRGGVSTYDVTVMKTVMVVGRLITRDGKILDGAYVNNHAGKTMSESDGMFTLEVHAENPMLSVSHRSGVACDIMLNPDKSGNKDIIFSGNLICENNRDI